MKTAIIAALAAAAVAAPAPGNKKGLAYNDANAIKPLAGAVSWGYNWAAADNSPKEGIPMCHGGGCDAGPILNKISKGHTPWVLGYNEPDETKANGGCTMSPQQARAAWAKDMLKFHEKKVKLVCPAVTSFETDKGHTGGPAGLTWLRQFVGGKPGDLKCEAQALHWYGVQGKSGAEQGQLFIDYMNHAHKSIREIFGRDIEVWVTEFAPLPPENPKVVSDFLKKVLPFLDGQSWVARYSLFKAEHLVSGGKLNEAGQTFVSHGHK